MKTSLHTYIFKYGTYDFKKIDLMGRKFCRFWRENKLLPKRLERCALYHFFTLTMYFLSEYCRREDFTIESFFKLLFAEIKDINYQTSNNTVFDVLISDEMDNDQNLFNMYMAFDSFIEILPEPDYMYKLYLDAFENCCEEKEIEFDRNSIEILWQERENEAAEEKRIKAEKTSMNNVSKSLNALLQFINTKEEGSLNEAINILEQFSPNEETGEEIKKSLIELINKYK